MKRAMVVLGVAASCCAAHAGPTQGVATNTVVKFRQVFSYDGATPTRLAIAAVPVYFYGISGK